MKFITLLTDFGLRDGYNGVMKGVIYGIAPDAQIADISHTIRPQNISEGSLAWSRSYAFFPEGTVHVAVVDPGVGTHRRPIAAQLGNYFFVCPDNGLITPILEEAENAGQPVTIVHLDQPRFWLPKISNVFHGRDIFSPVAAHLANGVSIEEMGTRISDPVRFHLPEAEAIKNGWRGQVIGVDHFGNLSTNLSDVKVSRLQNAQIRVAGREINGVAETFGNHAAGELVAVMDSDGRLAIAVVNGNAAKEIGVDLGEMVEMIEKA